MPSVKDTMAEFKAGKLHSGSKDGPLVKDRKQAVAIAVNQGGKHPHVDRHPSSGRFVPKGRFAMASNPPGSRVTQ